MASNTTVFYYNEYDKAYKLFKEGQADAAEDACCGLISDFQYPCLIQTQAGQLRSVCTKDYWFGRSHLTKALDLIASMNDDEDELLAHAKKHTESMLADKDKRWAAEWAKKGQEPPTEQRNDDTYVVSGSSEEQAMLAQEAEAERKKRESEVKKKPRLRKQ